MLKTQPSHLPLSWKGTSSRGVPTNRAQPARVAEKTLDVGFLAVRLLERHQLFHALWCAGVCVDSRDGDLERVGVNGAAGDRQRRGR